PPGRPHPVATTQFGLNGTDLGISVEHAGRMYLFFGDSSEFYYQSDFDPIAWVTTADPHDLELWAPDVHWVLGRHGLFHALSIDGNSLGNFEVPTGGFSWDGRLYLFVGLVRAKNKTRMTQSELVVRDDTKWDFQTVSQSSSTTGSQILILEPDGTRRPAPFPCGRWMLHISPTVVR